MHRSPLRLLSVLLLTACAACSSLPTQEVPSETSLGLPEHMPVAALSTCAKSKWLPSSLKRNEQGVTTFALLVGADGKVSRAELISSSGSVELDSAARAMVASCRFAPAIVGGQPVERWSQSVFVWSIDDDIRPSSLARQLSGRAALGQADAQYALYVLLGEDKEYAAGDKAAALTGLLVHSAQAGFCPAKFSLGNRYARGKASAHDAAQAREWFRQAEACGHPMARQALEELDAGSEAPASGK